MSRKSQFVHRRKVYYIPGYDPFPPRRYRELYREEGAVQAEISGYELGIEPLRSPARFGWRVKARMDRELVESDISVLVWSDIVRDSMEQGLFSTYLQLIRTAAAYIGTGALFRLMRLRKGPVIAALYPVVFLLAQLALALTIAWALGKLLSLWHPMAAWAGLVAIFPVLAWFRKRDGRFFAYYLMHDYAFTARHLGANDPALELRMAGFADEIAQALSSECDEVLVVGHSSGAHLAVSVLADVIRSGRVPGQAPALAFLSLGQVIPMVAFLPRAGRLRADLAYLAQSNALTWVDVSAPGDGCSFALCDPVAVSGVAPEAKRWPLVLSAAFSQTLGPARWKALRWRLFRLHFQYLCAFDRPGEYDYFKITAGPMTLQARYEGRVPSKSRIERPLSGYTSLSS